MTLLVLIRRNLTVVPVTVSRFSSKHNVDRCETRQLRRCLVKIKDMVCEVYDTGYLPAIVKL